MRPALLALALAACATTGVEGRGNVALPSAGVGPFRKLDTTEVQGVAPFVLEDKLALYAEPAALGENDEVVLFVAQTLGKGGVIARTRATDGRSFFGASGDIGHAPEVVLRADQPWEGGSVGGPFALRRGAELLLFYAAVGGIGLARSTDGHAFVKDPGPLVPAPARAPSAYIDEGGRLHVLYASGAHIEEAVDGRPVGEIFSPAAVPAVLGKNEKPPFDTAAVDDPCVITRTTPAGRFVVQVLYTGRTADGATAIGLAARYGDEGPLERQPVPVYAIGQKEAAPAFAPLGSGAFLYVQQERRAASGGDVPFVAVAAAYAPADVKAGETAPFPPSP